jgi:hypothetical protein
MQMSLDKSVEHLVAVVYDWSGTEETGGEPAVLATARVPLSGGSSYVPFVFVSLSSVSLHPPPPFSASLSRGERAILACPSQVVLHTNIYVARLLSSPRRA